MKREAGGAISALTVKVHPRSSRERISVADDGLVHVWVTAAAADGAANRAVVRCLAEALDLAPTRISIKSGHASRVKRLHVPLDDADVVARLRTLGDD